VIYCIQRYVRGRLIFFFQTIILQIQCLDPSEQKKVILKSMEERDDLDIGLAKLVDRATKCNILRFQKVSIRHNVIIYH